MKGKVLLHRFQIPAVLTLLTLAAACARSPMETGVVQPLPTPTPLPATGTASPLAVQASPQPPTPGLLPLATSRGPNLEATDPSTVVLASGRLQLVEFFRFT